MKKANFFHSSKPGIAKRPPHRYVFAPVKAIKAKRRSASPEGYYTDVTLSTYKKLRMVILNFL